MTKLISFVVCDAIFFKYLEYVILGLFGLSEFFVIPHKDHIEGYLKGDPCMKGMKLHPAKIRTMCKEGMQWVLHHKKDFKSPISSFLRVLAWSTFKTSVRKQ